MSNRPSTMDTFRSTATSATQTVAETLNPSQNQGSDNQKSDLKKDVQVSSDDKPYKQQLDEAAYRYDAAEKKKEETQKESLVEKVLSYIPGISSTHESKTEKSSDEPRKDDDMSSATTPERPRHDLQVEQFLREQYKSNAAADMPDVGK